MARPTRGVLRGNPARYRHDGPLRVSKRWCNWKGVDVIFDAARAAIDAGPFDPPICEIIFDEEYQPFTVDTLEEAREHLMRGSVRSMEIIVAHFDEDEARVTLLYSGDRLSSTATAATGHVRARPTRGPAELAGQFKSRSGSKLPRDAVGETRKRPVIEELEAALETSTRARRY